jgi:hypothetical protein
MTPAGNNALYTNNRTDYEGTDEMECQQKEDPGSSIIKGSEEKGLDSPIQLALNAD